MLTLAYPHNAIGGADMFESWGSYPGYTSVQYSDFNNAGEQACMIQGTYNSSFAPYKTLDIGNGNKLGAFGGETRKMWSRRPRLLRHRLESLCHQRTAVGGCSTFSLLISWTSPGLLGYPHLGGAKLDL